MALVPSPTETLARPLADALHPSIAPSFAGAPPDDPPPAVATVAPIASSAAPDADRLQQRYRFNKALLGEVARFQHINNGRIPDDAELDRLAGGLALRGFGGSSARPQRLATGGPVVPAGSARIRA